MGECSLVCVLASSGFLFVRLPPGGPRRVPPCRCSAGPVDGSLRGVMLGVVVRPRQVSGCSAGGWGRYRRPVGCLLRGQAWLGWVRAVAARGALWLAGQIGSWPESLGPYARRPAVAGSVVGAQPVCGPGSTLHRVRQGCCHRGGQARHAAWRAGFPGCCGIGVLAVLPVSARQLGMQV